MLKNSDLIIFSLSRWDAPYSSPSFSLAKEFAKNNRVFYIDHPFSVKDFLLRYGTPSIQKRKNALLHGENIYTKSDRFPERLTMVTPRLTLPINFLPDGPLYDLLARYNDGIIFDCIRRIIRDHKVRQFVFLNAFDPYFCRDFPADIRPVKKVYQSMDDLTQVHYTAKHGTRLEADIVRKFDVTLTTSQELRRLKLKHSSNVFLHPNAADFSSFSRALTENFPRPAELEPAVGKKIVGYTGNIESRIDYELMKAIIEYHPDKVIAMVGPVTTGEHKTIGLTEYPNVIMTGPKKIDQLPAYLQYFDCALIPFKKNTLTRSIYPLKINEYLAAGRPVVATDFSEDIQAFGDVIYIGRDTAEFVQLIDQAIQENDRSRIEARTKVANANTWTARVDKFWEIIENQRILSPEVGAGHS
ncbi:MAG: glycosyltransferase [Bacteroidota bacterium]|nr:glycosyltransferase [Bacteroidota bacterium]